MEIIKRGQLPEEVTYKGSCRKCGTIARAKVEELRMGYSQKDGDFGQGACPVCGDLNMIFYIDPQNGL